MYNVVSDIIVGFGGFFGGLLVSLVYFRLSPSKAAAAAPPDGKAGHNPANDAARARMAAQQLRDLAQNMASDVGAHHTAIGSMSSELSTGCQRGGDQNAMVLDVVRRMLTANEKLQGRLEDAERRIQSQADEIRTQHTEARTDVLTGLANRRAFDDCLEDNAKRFLRDGRPYALVMFDIDNFKGFNDAHGHLAGDEALRTVGQTLTRVVKGGDFACRYGGEEFAVIMPGTAIRDARTAGERIRKALEEMTVSFDGRTHRLTASLGVAESARGEAANRLVRRADDCVYEAKQAGRNCGYWHTGAECLPIAAPPTPAVAAAATGAAAPTAAIKLPTLAPQAAPATREVFAELLNRRIAETQRSGAALAVLVFRINQLPELERLYGAAVGKLVLQWLSSYIRSSLREMDVLGYSNPDELAVMLPGSTESAARIVGQRMTTAISAFPIPLGQAQLRLEVIFGAASIGAGDQAPEAIAHARADADANANQRAAATAEMAGAR